VLSAIVQNTYRYFFAVIIYNIFQVIKKFNLPPLVIFTRGYFVKYTDMIYILCTINIDRGPVSGVVTCLGSFASVQSCTRSLNYLFSRRNVKSIWFIVVAVSVCSVHYFSNTFYFFF